MRRLTWLFTLAAVSCSAPPAPGTCDPSHPCRVDQTCLMGQCQTTCGPANCLGCCSSATTCQLGTQSATCGSNGQFCQACPSGAGCVAAVCVFSMPGGGAGGGAGGGMASGGPGGGGATGGGLGGGSSDAGIDCFDDADCPDPSLFFCNTTTSKCEPGCRVKADCSAAVRGAWALPFCDANPLGCQCDEGSCRLALCSADVDCGTQVCRDGACVAAPLTTTVARCEVVPDFVVMRGGSKVRFAALTWDAAGNPVVPTTGHQWSSLNAAVTGSGVGRTQEFTASAGASAGPVDAVQLTLGAATCKARAIVVRSVVPANTLDVVVVDELTGRPVPNVTMQLSAPATGLTIGAPALTDALGVASLTLTGTTAVTVSAFHNDYDSRTIVGYDVAAGSRTLVVALRRNPFDRLGGFKGTFTGVPVTSNVHLGNAALGQPSFHEPRLLAPDVPTHVKIGSAIDQMNVPVAAASLVGFSNQPIKDLYAVLGLNGVCHSGNGAPDELTMALGGCGGATAWGLTCDVPLGDLPIDAFAGGMNNVDWGRVVGRLQPLYKRFNSSVWRDLEFNRVATLASADGGWVLSDTTNLASRDLAFAQLPLAFSFAVRSPDLPAFRGKYADLVLLRGAAIVPGRGLVDLGLDSAANSTPLDAKTDATGGLPAGLMPMRMAPTHHGLEGGTYVVVASAITSASLDQPLQGSTLVTRLPQNRLPFDPLGATPVTFPTGYLGLPDGAHYNFAAVAQGALGPRALRFATDPGLSSATVLNVTFTDRLGRRWVVSMDPALATTGFALPAAPGGSPDRTFWDGVLNGARSSMRLEALALTDQAPITFQRWFELGSGHPTRLLDFTTAFSFADYGRATVRWLSPAASGAVLARGVTLTVQVTGFKVGTAPTDDGFVRLTFVGGTGCSAVDLTSDPTGQGTPSVVLPLSCTGTNLQMTATLHDRATGVALAPPVSETVTVTLQ